MAGVVEEAEVQPLPLAEQVAQAQQPESGAGLLRVRCWRRARQRAGTGTLATVPPNAGRPLCAVHCRRRPLINSPLPPRYHHSVSCRAVRGAVSAEVRVEVRVRRHRQCGGREGGQQVIRPVRTGEAARRARLRTAVRESWCGRRCGTTFVERGSGNQRLAKSSVGSPDGKLCCRRWGRQSNCDNLTAGSDSDCQRGDAGWAEMVVL